MSSVTGRFFRVSTFGESHGPAVGVIVDGVPAGLELTRAVVQSELDKRKPGGNQYVSQRSEPDIVEILSGVANDVTLGSPIAMVVRNTNQRSGDYLGIADLFRPGHADYSYFLKYGITPQPGGGRSSGRETVGRVAAGAIAKLILGKIGSTISAYTIRVGDVIARRVDIEFAISNPLRCADPNVADQMADMVSRARSDGDSVGGIIEVIVEGAPQGLGDPVFDKLDASLGAAMLSIGGVKGIEFGDGFKSASLRGSEHNDEMNSVGFLSNHCGGILGGISTGQPIVMRLAVKPTASISLDQKTVDTKGRERVISVKGRHDPCLCPRIAPVAEAMAAITLADAWLADRAIKGASL
ncbi:MAG: chorismate synthase [Desulfomonilaceae bacterium]